MKNDIFVFDTKKKAALFYSEIPNQKLRLRELLKKEKLL